MSQQKAGVIKEKLGERIKSLNYIKRLHQGEVYWFNVIKITPEDILNYYHPSTIQKRVESYFYLGVSVAPMLQIENGHPFINACSQLIEEYDYHFSTVARRGLKILKSMTSTSHKAVGINQLKKNPQTGNVTYEYLRTPNVPVNLSYREVIFSLCDILTFVYRKLMDGLKPRVTQSVINLDSQFKSHLFGRISKDVNNLAMYKLKKQGDILSSEYSKSVESGDGMNMGEVKEK